MISIVLETCLEENSKTTGSIPAVYHLETNKILAIIAQKISYKPIKTSNLCEDLYHPSPIIAKNILDYLKTSKANPIETILQ